MGQISYNGCELVQTKVCQLISFYELSGTSHFVVTSRGNRQTGNYRRLRLVVHIIHINESAGAHKMGKEEP
ncbi:hypothetical protein EDB69_1621 [Vibrio crassostreae]|nr:hypothetical protein EDB64_3738 [Vibrio crassostreae]ROP13114.1 hypothetical protein EDB63_0096 [Vibrio crassostreae]ROQ87189.1 hypothetical protein EDB72_0723 [Vibrio crassostreae]ROR88440.1 hypothetical protein EDB66_1392 [Vibrio crassostreae]RPE89986.1 hypothetical protein EDB68_3644 [Vibrio crassostreae]